MVKVERNTSGRPVLEHPNGTSFLVSDGVLTVIHKVSTHPVAVYAAGEWITAVVEE